MSYNLNNFEELDGSMSDASEPFGVIDTSDSGLSTKTIKNKLKDTVLNKMIKQEKTGSESSENAPAKKSKKKHKHIKEEVNSPNVTYSDTCQLGLKASTPLSKNNKNQNKCKDYLSSIDMSKIPNEIDNMLDSVLKHKKHVSQKANFDSTDSDDKTQSKKRNKTKRANEHTYKNYYDDHVKNDLDENGLVKEIRKESNSQTGTETQDTFSDELTTTKNTYLKNESIEEKESEIEVVTKKIKKEKKKRKRTQAVVDSQSQCLNENAVLGTIMDNHIVNESENKNCSEKNKSKRNKTNKNKIPEEDTVDFQNRKKLQLIYDSSNETSSNTDKLDKEKRTRNGSESDIDMKNMHTTPTFHPKKHTSTSELIQFEDDNKDNELGPLIQRSYSVLKHKKHVSQKANFDSTDSDDKTQSKKRNKTKRANEHTYKNYYDDHVKIDLDENGLVKEIKKESNSQTGTETQDTFSDELTTTKNTYLKNESIEEKESEIEEVTKKIKKEKKKRKRTQAVVDSQSQCLNENEVLGTIMDNHIVNDSENENCSEKNKSKRNKTNKNKIPEEDTVDFQNRKKLQLIYDSSNETSSNTDKLDKEKRTRNGSESDIDMKNMHTTPTFHPKKHTSTSELIQFEDDNKDNELGPLIQRYLETNPHLKPVPDCGPKIKIGEDDEIWIVTCPVIPAESFKGLNLNLGGKTKLKVDGQTYEGITEEEDNRIGLLTSGETKGSFVIRNINPVASIKFRPKIPKPHFNFSSILEDHQTDLIPLPETKTRHPLFGADYSEYINLPKHIKEKLKHPDQKHKPKTKQETLEFQGNIKSESSTSKKKKKKRKHSDSEEETVVKHKKIKKDPDYQKVWDSDKAIEESLFNF